MGSIRKQTIISSILVYIGFLIGFVNIYLYTVEGSFTPEQFALTRIFFDFAQIMFSFGSLGIIPVIYKFYPYYKDNLAPKRIDLATWVMGMALIGFGLVLIGGWYLEPLFVKKFIAKSSLVLDYYVWLFPFAMGMLFFSVIEGFSWAVHQSVVSNFLKETLMRVLTTLLIALFYFRVISYSVFIYLFSMQYLVIFIILVIYLYRTGNLHFSFRVSRVTKKYWKKMAGMQGLLFSGTVIAAVSATVDSIIIASIQGLAAAGIFVFAQNFANLIQVPYRSITAISAGVLSRAWKDKDYAEINRVYYRSSINLLLMGLFIFGNMWLCISDAIDVLNIQKTFLEGLNVIFVLCIVRILDAATGLNTMIINTSNFWRFDFYSNVILLAFRLPLTYFLIKTYGIIGSAYAELITYAIINTIRCEFLRRKFKMMPFSMKTLYSVLLVVAVYFLTYLLFSNLHGWSGLFLKAGVFSSLMIAGIFYWKLTPDAGQLYDILLKRMGRRRD